MAIDIKNKRVLVVGASGGMGAAIARAFAAAGARVSAAGRPSRNLDEIASDVGGTLSALDVLDNDAVEAFFQAEEAFDHVVIAAASTSNGTIADLPIEEAQASMNSKFWGAYRIARVAKIVDGGSITFISGSLSQRPLAGAVLQGAINAAIEALARGLALERAPIRVNTVSPGLIDTKLWHSMDAAERQKMFDQVAGGLPARRVGQPDDIAQAVLYVATNPFVSGTTAVVDGGGLVA